MEHGDISNQPVPKVGFRFEEIIRRSTDGKLNRTGKAYLDSIARHDIDVVLFTTGDSRRVRAFCYKWGVHYNQAQAVDSILDLILVIREQNLIAYYDTDKDILSKIKERIYGDTEAKLWTLASNLYLE